jgi:uncharacterized membrane protein YdbT with pleckstrin-like domain
MGYVAGLMGQDEHTHYVTRHHWTKLAARIWALTLLMIVAAIAAIAANTFGAEAIARAGLGPNEVTIGTAVFVALFAICPLIAMVVAYLRWHGDQFIVTNYRVIHVSGILAKSVIDSSLEKVNDVMLTQSLLGRLLDFGSIEIMTSSDIGVNKLDRIGRPLAFKKAMLDAKQDIEDPNRGSIGDLPGVLNQLADLRDRGILTAQEYEAKKSQLLRGT